jgi:hypothetical protein
VNDAKSVELLAARQLEPVAQSVGLRGIEREVQVYAIP